MSDKKFGENENSRGGGQKKFQDPTLICYIYLLDEEELENTRREAIEIFKKFCNYLGVQFPEPSSGLIDDGFIVRGELGFVRKIPDHHVVQIIFTDTRENEKFDGPSIMKAWMENLEKAGEYLKSSSYYGIVFYAVNRDLKLPDNFSYKDYGIDFDFKNNEYVNINGFRLYFPKEVKTEGYFEEFGAALAIISDSEEWEEEVLAFLKDRLLNFLYSYLLFMDHSRIVSSIFARHGEDIDSGIMPVLTLEKKAGGLIDRYFSLSSEESDNELSSGLLSVSELMKEIEDITVSLSEYYAKVSQNLSMLFECRNTMEIHYLNLCKTTQEQYRLNFPSLGIELDKMLKQVDFDIKYTDAFLQRISKILESAKLKLDVIRSGESFKVQRESLKIQRASEVIEFVVVLYYFTRIWDFYSPESFEALGIFSFIIAVAFSATITILTDKLLGQRFWLKK